MSIKKRTFGSDSERNGGGAQFDDGEYMAGLEKGLAVIEAFGMHHPRLAVSEAAKLTGLSRASARRCLLTLQRLGYADRDGKYYRLAPRALRLGHAYLTSTPLPRIIQPVLETISERTHESASLAILDGAEVVFIARSMTRRSLSFGVGVGTRLPAYCSATGRVLLADLPDASVAALLKACAPRRLTPRTLIGHKELLDEIRRVRSQGYAISDEEIEVGLRSIAVPVRDGSGKLLAAISLAVRASRMAREDMAERMLPALEAGRRMLAGML